MVYCDVGREGGQHLNHQVLVTWLRLLCLIIPSVQLISLQFALPWLQLLYPSLFLIARLHPGGGGWWIVFSASCRGQGVKHAEGNSWIISCHSSLHQMNWIDPMGRRHFPYCFHVFEHNSCPLFLPYFPLALLPRVPLHSPDPTSQAAATLAGAISLFTPPSK